MRLANHTQKTCVDKYVSNKISHILPQGNPKSSYFSLVHHSIPHCASQVYSLMYSQEMFDTLIQIRCSIQLGLVILELMGRTADRLTLAKRFVVI